MKQPNDITLRRLSQLALASKEPEDHSNRTLKQAMTLLDRYKLQVLMELFIKENAKRLRSRLSQNAPHQLRFLFPLTTWSSRIGVSARTLSRELKRGIWIKGFMCISCYMYKAELSQYKADEVQKRKGRKHKYTLAKREHDAIKKTLENGVKEFAKRMQLKVRLQELKDDLSAWALLYKKVKQGVRQLGHRISDRESIYVILKDVQMTYPNFEISERRIYQYIHDALFEGVTTTNRLLPYKKKKVKGKVTTPHNVKNKQGCHMSDRPISILERKDFGHCEVDHICPCRGGKKRILSIIERLTRHQDFIILEDGTAEITCEALRKFFKKNKWVKTLTFDNGSEFSNVEQILKDLRLVNKEGNIYFADSYASYQRGSNENNHKMFRRFFPKKTHFDTLTPKELSETTAFINGYRRRIFDGQSASLRFYFETVKSYA